MKVAVVGGGVSGLAATWLLNEHSSHDVHLIEAADYPGGHTHTVRFTKPTSSATDDKPPSCWVDTGFIVFNTVTYPNLLRFLRLVKIPFVGSDMSFSVSRDRGLFEWAGGSPAQLFAQKKNFFDPGHWLMIWDIIRFNAFSTDILKEIAEDEELSIGTYLKRHGYSDSFRDNYLLPMTAAIWSTPPDKAALDFPARTLIRFMHNHHLLQILDRPQWLTITDGSHRYVERILEHLPPGRVHLDTPVASFRTRQLSDGERKITLRREDGSVIGEYDHVILATHADQALRILDASGNGPSDMEREVLSGFQFSKNVATLHADPALMPQRRSTWSAWNYLTKATRKGGKGNVNEVALTYWMNLLQSISEDKFGPVLVTLNPPFPPAPELTIGSWPYEHPLYTSKSVASQKRLHTIQNTRGISYAGAWTNYGFHEDGFTSGLRVAVDHLGASSPFDIRDAERDVVPTPTLAKLAITWLELVRKVAVAYIALWLFLLSRTPGLARIAPFHAKETAQKPAIR